MARLVNLPLVGNARESVKGIPVGPSDTLGIAGSAENFGVNENANIREAKRLEGEPDGVNVVTGRSKGTKFTGAR